MSDPKIGPDGHPIPEVQGVVSTQHEPVRHYPPPQGGVGNAAAEGKALGTLIPDPTTTSKEPGQ